MIIIDVSVDMGRLRDRLHNISRNMPKNMGDAGYELMRKFAMNLRAQVMMKNLIWRRNLLRGIRAEKKNQNMSYVKMPLYGIYLDRMRPHWVSLKRGRLITQWARDKGIRARGVYVKPHPFIVEGMTRTYPQINQIIKTYADKAVRES